MSKPNTLPIEKSTKGGSGFSPVSPSRNSQPSIQVSKQEGEENLNQEEKKSTKVIEDISSEEDNPFLQIKQERLKSGHFQPFHLLHKTVPGIFQLQAMKPVLAKQDFLYYIPLDPSNDIPSPIQWSPLPLSERKPQQATSYQRTQRFQELPQRKRPRATRNKEKGLRKLSAHAFKAVKNLGQATYKEVSNELIHQMNVEEILMDEFKQQNNIKRRVYDALNVLIALGALKKNGHMISYENTICNQRVSRIFEKKLQRQSQLKKKQLSLRSKMRQLKIKRQKMFLLDHLKARNVNNEKESNTANINQPKQPQQLADRKETHINFPFVCIQVTGQDIKQDTISKIELSNKNTYFQMPIAQKTGLYCFGDVDSLSKFII